MPGLAKMADAIHSNGALAGIELAYSGANGPNLYTREVPLAPSHLPILTFTSDPVQARAMDKQDIRNLRHWHKLAYRRARRAGFDILCLYGAHGFGDHPAFPLAAHQSAHATNMAARSRTARGC